MITKASHSFIYVLNQDEALDFYTNKLGFTLRANIPLGPNKRWLTVSPPGQNDIEFVLMHAQEGPFFTREKAEQLNDVVRAGILGWCVFECIDIYTTYEELKAKGVKFKDAPIETPAGISANFYDNSGNFFSLTQKK